MPKQRTLSLKDLQQQFSKAITQGDFSELSTLVEGSETLGATERLSIYRENYFGSLTGALKEVYPVCVKIVGENYFKQIARNYVQKNASGNQNLNFYGETFPDYLDELVKTREEASELVYLPDVARLEWAFNCAFYAADDSPFNFEAFEKAVKEAEDRLCFVLAASARLVFQLLSHLPHLESE